MHGSIDDENDETTASSGCKTHLAGLDADRNRKMLVGVASLAKCFDCDTSTIRRWARSGVMPEPMKVGGRTLSDAEKIRAWIKDDCPRCDEK